MSSITITNTIPRSEVTTEWAMWVKVGRGTHAVKMFRDSDQGAVWVETDAGTASTYARVHGMDHAARIVNTYLG